YPLPNTELDVDRPKQLITHCITDEMIDMAAQETKRNRSQPETKKRYHLQHSQVFFQYSLQKYLMCNILGFTPAFARKAYPDAVMPTAVSTVRRRILLDISFLNIDNPEEPRPALAFTLSRDAYWMSRGYTRVFPLTKAGDLLSCHGSAQQVPNDRPRPVQPREATPISYNFMYLADMMASYVHGPSMNNLHELSIHYMPTTQMRTYEHVNLMAGTKAGRAARKSNLGELMRNILDTTTAATATAKCARPSMTSHVVSFMHPTNLYFIPSVLSEAMVGVNEKTHDVTHDLLVAVDHKMKARVAISSERAGDMEGIASESQATISEDFTMMTASLAGIQSPMAPAATMSRLLFEIRKDLDPAMVLEMSSMLDLYINSSNHEIVKPAFRFITTIGLDFGITRPRLQEIVSGIVRWSHEHKGHFKVKVRHTLVSDKNLLVNIMKRCERAKRKKSNTPEMEMEGDADKERKREEIKPRATFGRAYEDTLYGIEGYLGDDFNGEGEDSMTGKMTRRNSKGDKEQMHGLRKTPIFYLISRIAQCGMSQLPTQALRHHSVDGFTSEQGGKIRFNKTNRRGAQGKDEDMELEMAGGAGPIRSKLKEKEQAKVIDRSTRLRWPV
ncbi:hypothetical protein BGX34_003301, partial [Mortierella sp. NVP85]